MCVYVYVHMYVPYCTQSVTQFTGGGQRPTSWGPPPAQNSLTNPQFPGGGGGGLGGGDF